MAYQPLFIVIAAQVVKAVGIKMNDDLTDDMSPATDQESYDEDMPKGEKAKHNSDVRKRIDDLLERKRLKELLDDSDDWDI